MIVIVEDNEQETHTGRLKSNSSASNTGYQFLHFMFYKIIYFILLCTFKASAITSKTIVYIFETLFKVVTSTPITICNWINKPHIRYTKKYCKTSNGSGKFSHNLRASKKSYYNVRNCKSRRHGRQHTFMKHKSQTKHTTKNNSNQDLKIKDRKLRTFKSPPLQRLNRMLRVIDHWESHQGINNKENYSLSYDEPDLCNNYISKEVDKVDRFPSVFLDIVS